MSERSFSTRWCLNGLNGQLWWSQRILGFPNGPRYSPTPGCARRWWTGSRIVPTSSTLARSLTGSGERWKAERSGPGPEGRRLAVTNQVVDQRNASLRLKEPSGWFAAGDSFRQALLTLSD